MSLCSLLLMVSLLFPSVHQVDHRQFNTRPLSQKSRNSSVRPDTEHVWVSLEHALRESRPEHKKILIDFYADWCRYCALMGRKVFPNPKVRNMLVKYFYAVKINVDSGDSVSFNNKKFTEQQLANSFGIKELPTIVFLNSNGKPIAAQPGFIPPHMFHKMLKYFGTGVYQKMKFSRYDPH